MSGSVSNKVYGYNTKYKEGFLPDEIEAILKEYPGINMEKFNNALTGITCQMREGKFLIYHCDIVTALNCGIENRDMKQEEFD